MKVKTGVWLTLSISRVWSLRFGYLSESVDLDVPLQKQKCYKITSVWTKLMFRNGKRLRDVMQLHLCHAAHEWMSQLGLFTSSDSPPHDLYVRSGLARFVLWRIPLKRVRWENTISIREDRMGITSIPCCFYLKHEWVLYVKGVTLTHTHGEPL